MKRRWGSVLAGCAMGCLLIAGCATRQQVAATPPPAPRPQSTPTEATAPAPKVTAHYVVRKGDNLWAIASRKRILGDPFEWPLLYRENRDQIKDPDLIYPSEDLTVTRLLSKQELQEIRKIARETRPYARKAKRKTLPVG